MKMKHQEVYQLLKYRRQELSSRLQSIKNDFSATGDMDDVLFNIAHETKVELANIKVAIEEIEAQTYGYCKICSAEMSTEELCQSPFKTTCNKCGEKN